MFMFNNPWMAGTISIFINSLFFVMLITWIVIFRAALQPYIDNAQRKYCHCSGLISFSILKCIFTPDHPSISAQYHCLRILLVVTILFVQSRDLSCDQLKRLHDQRVADVLNDSLLLEYCRSFDAGLWLLHEKQNTSLISIARISVSHLKPAKAAIMGYFAGGSIANIVQ